MKKNLFILMASMSLFAACKKNANDVNQPTPGPGATSAKVKTRSSTGVTTYTYDANGRQLKSIQINGSGYEYEYLPGIINVKSLGAGGVYQYTDIYEMNTEGLCTRMTNSNNPAAEDLFLYNADKTLAKQIMHSNGNTIVIDYFYSNGNCDSTRYINNGNWQNTRFYTFYTDKSNVLSYVNTGEDFFGKVNKNLQKSEVYKYPNGTSGTTANNSYEYDALGRVTKKTTTFGNNIDISLYTYY